MGKTYFCTDCKKNHRSGKIYDEHLQYKEEEKEIIPSKKLLHAYSLSEIAKRQIMHYIDKMIWDEKFNHSKKREMYITEINRVILHEDNNNYIIKI